MRRGQGESTERACLPAQTSASKDFEKAEPATKVCRGRPHTPSDRNFSQQRAVTQRHPGLNRAGACGTCHRRGLRPHRNMPPGLRARCSPPRQHCRGTRLCCGCRATRVRCNPVRQVSSAKTAAFFPSQGGQQRAGFQETERFPPCEAGRVKVFHSLALIAMVIMKHIAQQAADVHTASPGSRACQAQIPGLQDVES